MKRRNLIVLVLLYLVTLSLYGIYWLYATRKEMVSLGQKIKPFWMLFVPLMIFIVGLLAFLASSVNSEAEASQRFSTAMALTMGFAVIAAVIVAILFFSSYCKAVENVTAKGLTYGFNFALAIIMGVVGIPLIWHLLNQYHFNRITAHKDQIPDTPYPTVPHPSAPAS